MMAALSLSAQLNDQSRLNLNFAVLPLDSALVEQELFYTDDGEPSVSNAVELSLNPRERSQYYHYQGPNPMPIFHKVKDKEEKTQLIQAYQISFPDVRGEWLVLLEKTTQAPPPYRSHTFLYDESAFPEGSVLFFNTTAASFSGILGENELKIEPGSNQPIDISAYYQGEAPLGLIVKDGDQIHKVLYSKLSFSPDRRTLMILRPPKRPDSYRIQAQRINEYLGKFDPDDPGA
ncbi:hypothetical protein JIN80_11940 [Cerasicoccus arenae]|nr:hypothetical protein [Cerasicoccus arenae]